MSLLDGGRETVTIFAMVDTVDPDGNTVRKPSATGVAVAASVQPIASTEPAVAGQQTVTTYRVRCNRNQLVPVGPWAQVAWRGRDWDVDGEPARYTGSTATAHVAFRIRARVSAAV
ncbi:head-tail adaptor protein [Alloactinosynnema sp. L-07]|uniref:phage head completion protein n=1 Tax=Alloactinosynnema sp. L-07 TaxID=1653480 RepID=UPI0006B4C57C|nr:head-tail adaptor protein [Alloactinosynnema sp. L-07]